MMFQHIDVWVIFIYVYYFIIIMLFVAYMLYRKRCSKPDDPKPLCRERRPNSDFSKSEALHANSGAQTHQFCLYYSITRSVSSTFL